MSTHLLIAAAYLEDLPQGRKLVLMAIADSGDEHSLESAPGLPKLRAWSGLSRSAALANVRALIEAGLVDHVAAGRLGRRAVYRVFPGGVPAIPHPTAVAARYAEDADTEPVDNPVSEGPASKTLGSCSPPSRVLPAGPLQSYPSVSIARAAAEPVETRRPAPPASGFPGSRDTVIADREERRRAQGANDQPCPVHPAMIVPCGRCANDASKITEEERLDRLRVLRAEHLAAISQPVAPPTDTEEPTAS